MAPSLPQWVFTLGLSIDRSHRTRAAAQHTVIAFARRPAEAAVLALRRIDVAWGKGCPHPKTPHAGWGRCALDVGAVVRPHKDRCSLEAALLLAAGSSDDDGVQGMRLTRSRYSAGVEPNQRKKARKKGLGSE